MKLNNFLKIFFGLPAEINMKVGLPASLLRSITVAAYPALDAGSQHFCCRNAVQLQLSMLKSPTKYLKNIICIICVINISHANAQVDSNYVDTVSMHHIKPLQFSDTGVISNDTNGYGYDDQNEGYADTTTKHIYDTSQNFFNKKDANAVYVNEKITPRHFIDEDVKALKNDDDFWYIPAIEKLETRLKNDPKFRDSLLNAKNHELTDNHKNDLIYQPWFNTLIWCLIIGVFAAALIYFLLQNKINIFSKDAASGDETNEAEQENIFNLSYTKLIQHAEREKDYRVAIRLLFLQTLKLLSNSNAIHYQPDYTDLNYLEQLQQSKYYEEFFKVMRSYEYVWYGKFTVSTESYTTVKNDFLMLLRKIS